MPKAADGLLAPGEGSTSTPDVNNAGASSLPIEENAERSKRPTSWPTESTKSADLPPVEDYSVITERSLEGKMVRYHVSPEGKRTLIPDDVRPPRRTIVQMASGYPEPHVWPPTRRAQNKRDELHPLYKFFKIQPEALVCVNESEDPNEWKSSPPKVGALPDVDIEVFSEFCLNPGDAPKRMAQWLTSMSYSRTVMVCQVAATEKFPRLAHTLVPLAPGEESYRDPAAGEEETSGLTGYWCQGLQRQTPKGKF
jgi:hypothetical protein